MSASTRGNICEGTELTSSDKTMAWYTRQGVTDHELRGTGIYCGCGLYPVDVDYILFVLETPWIF